MIGNLSKDLYLRIIKTDLYIYIYIYIMHHHAMYGSMHKYFCWLVKPSKMHQIWTAGPSWIQDHVATRTWCMESTARLASKGLLSPQAWCTLRYIRYVERSNLGFSELLDTAWSKKACEYEHCWNRRDDRSKLVFKRSSGIRSWEILLREIDILESYQPQLSTPSCRLLTLPPWLYPTNVIQIHYIMLKK